jgi:hypothetical protein
LLDSHRKLLDLPGNRVDVLGKHVIAHGMETPGKHLVTADAACEQTGRHGGQEHPALFVLHEEVDGLFEVLAIGLLIAGLASRVGGVNAAGRVPGRCRTPRRWR